MKKIAISIVFLFFVCINSQQSILIINNYSPYDFHGNVTAIPATSCYPVVEIGYPADPSVLIIPADSHQGNGLNAYYKSFSTAGTPNLYPITTFFTKSSATNPQFLRVPGHVLLSPTSPSSTLTNWRHSKFEMYFAGTSTKVSSGGVNIPETYFNGNLDDLQNSCYGGSTYISTPYGDAEWSTVTSGTDSFTFIQIF